MPVREISYIKFLFVLAQLGAAVVREKAWSKNVLCELCGTCCCLL